MAEVLTKLREWITPSKVKTEGYLSPLFYKVTFGVCLFSFVILFGSQYFGDPIICSKGLAGIGVRDEHLESHCWKHGTRRIIDDSLLKG